MRHFANPAENPNPATFVLEPGLGRICKSGRFLAGAEILYSPINVGLLQPVRYGNNVLISRIVR